MNIGQLIKKLQDDSESDTHFIKELHQYNPNTLVQVSNGECEADGIYAPAIDGDYDLTKQKPFHTGEPFPDEYDHWIQVGYIPNQKQINVGQYAHPNSDTPLKRQR